MKITYTLESSNEILNGSKVEIRGKNTAEIEAKKAEIESRPVVIRLIRHNVKEHAPPLAGASVETGGEG